MTVKMNVKSTVNKRYEFVAPEGGWGYMIGLATIIIFSSFTMFVPCFGLLYDTFMNEIGMSTTDVTVMYGAFSVFVAISGYLASPLMAVLSFRKLLFIGTLLFNIGTIGKVFNNSLIILILCQNVLQGVGFGIVFNLLYTVMNDYFMKKRLMAISVVQTVVAIITMIRPLFVEWALKEYGFRSTLLLISGITLQSFVGVSLIQPVEWHLKKIEVFDLKKDSVMEHFLPRNKSSEVETDAMTSNEQNHDVEVSIKQENNNSIKKILRLLLDKELCKSFLMSCVSLGPALCVFFDSTFVAMLPQALFKANWDQDRVALALSLLNLGDLAMRIVFIFCSNWLIKLGTQELYIIGALIALISRLGMLWSKNEIVILIYIVISGVSRSWLVILFPVVIADAVPAHKFTAAMGLFLIIYGCINVVIGPAIGAVRDLTDSYGASFYIIASCFAMTILFWTIELIYKRNEHKRVQRLEYLKQKKLIKG